MSHCSKILKAIKENGSITSWEAIQNFRCTRLAARIRDLKDLGYNIKTKIKTNNNKRYAEYSLVENN